MVTCLTFAACGEGKEDERMPPGPEIISLPAVRQAGQISVEEALVKRASVREFLPQALTMEALAQLLWAGQGITRRWGGRTAPSAGALYPLELYVVLPMGTYRYLAGERTLWSGIRREICYLHWGRLLSVKDVSVRQPP